MRNTVYDQLLELQKNKRAWLDWQEYREKLTNWVISSCEEGNSIGIIGAGPCNDFNLISLSDYFSKIVLMDVRREEMEHGVDKQLSGLEEEERILRRKKLVIEEKDFLGISSEEYRGFSQGLSNMVNVYGRGVDMKDLEELALDYMEQSYEDALSYVKKQEFLKEKVDYLVVCGVHSQMNAMFPWIYEAFLQALGRHSEGVHKRARTFNNVFVPAFHDALFRSAKKGLLFGLEQQRMGLEGGIEGAYQGIIDLKARGIIKPNNQILWPFDLNQQIIYCMNLYCVNEKSMENKG